MNYFTQPKERLSPFHLIKSKAIYLFLQKVFKIYNMFVLKRKNK
ncbi:hypothetical protein [Candidatus Portiera aleyrodidarum]|nr:hypothetical protein [Candidatus Portiera aleyrodidarum]